MSRIGNASKVASVRRTLSTTSVYIGARLRHLVRLCILNITMHHISSFIGGKIDGIAFRRPADRNQLNRFRLGKNLRNASIAGNEVGGSLLARLGICDE